MRAPATARLAVAVAVIALWVVALHQPIVDAAAIPRCAPGSKATIKGTIAADGEHSYVLLPFRVVRGTTRVAVGYRWGDLGDGETVLDLGLWDEDGYRAYRGFRGWSGNRHGNLAEGEPPIFVRRDKATRNYNPGAVHPGVWHVELGVGTLSSEGARYTVVITCRAPRVGSKPVPDPVNAGHVARSEPGWYHGDFHMHAFHSNPNGPTQDEFVSHARDAGLDFLPITEYVINRHWKEWGATARANPDLLFWPGREAITYFGHAIVIGETPGVIEYRHGFEDVSLADIQTQSLGAGALFGIAHPTLYPPPLSDLCRGCFFELGEEIDWSAVDTIEVLTGPIVVSGFQNPFVATAIQLWEQKLMEGYALTAVSGSDDKLGPGLGSSATAIYATELSRPALTDGIRGGHAYVRTLGVNGSPELEMTATAADGQQGIFGDTLKADSASVTVTVRGGLGQTLTVYRDGQTFATVPITSDDFVYAFDAIRDPASGPLGTFFRVETANDIHLTTIGNPIFLAPPTASGTP